MATSIRETETEALVQDVKELAITEKKTETRPAELKMAFDDIPKVPVGDMWPRPYVMDEELQLRRVEPYYFTYQTNVKQRWRGRTLFEVFESEFRDRPLEYYRAAMVEGRVCVSGKVVGPDHVLKNGETISHTLHRHEPPVSSEPIGVIHEDDEMIVINKPSGIPVHPAGRYNFNTLTEIMRDERGYGFQALPCNRLDRLTSGIMFMAKVKGAAERIGVQIRSRTVRKEYIARAIGKFPDGEVVCDQPILAISPKLGLNRVRANGKTARTVFKRLAYYPPKDAKPEDEEAGFLEPNQPGKPWLKKKGYSVVRCLPVTGRTHQIRVHLQYLGHPIQNDPIYANQRVWGFDLGEADGEGTQTTDEDVISRLSRMGKDEVAQAVVWHDEMVDKYEKQRAEKMTGELCDLCDTPLYSDPGSHELALWLHSLRYEDAAGSWSYTSPLPRWALPPAGMDGPTTVGGMDELVEAVKDENPEIVSAV